MHAILYTTPHFDFLINLIFIRFYELISAIETCEKDAITSCFFTIGIDFSEMFFMYGIVKYFLAILVLLSSISFFEFFILNFLLNFLFVIKIF